MDVVGIVQRLGAAPDDGEGGRDVGHARRVRELHVLAVDGVAEQVGLDVRHPALHVELAHKVLLHDELRDVLHLIDGNPFTKSIGLAPKKNDENKTGLYLDLDAALGAVRDEDLVGAAGAAAGGVDARTEARTAADARPDPLSTK